MPLNEAVSIDYVAWARRANARWLVHHDLSRTAELYLSHLAQKDPQRLIPSCRNAYLMVWLRDSTEDPKPWFYCGLFSLATSEEMKTFLANHWLTRTVLTTTESQTTSSHLEGVGEMTSEKIRQIRQAVARLPDPA